MRKKDISFEPLFYLLFSIVATFSIIVGLVLMITKFFGYPYLFEGSVMFSIGLIYIYIAKLHSSFLDVIDTFTNTINNAERKISEKYNERIYPPDFQGDIFEGAEEKDIIKINSDMSPQEKSDLKRKYPHLAEIIETLSNVSNILGKKNSTFPQPSKYKPLTELSLKELKKQLQESIAKENFEQAALIKNEIENRE